MDGILSNTFEGKDMVESGYARPASVAQRIAETQNVDASGSAALGPPIVVSGDEAQAEEDDTSDRQRHRRTPPRLSLLGVERNRSECGH